MAFKPITLQDRINKFLSSTGGEVTNVDLTNLYDIIGELVRQRYQVTDGRSKPIEPILVNRQVHGPVHFLPVPYRHEVIRSYTSNDIEYTEVKDEKPLLERLYNILDTNVFNLSVATREYDLTYKMIQMEKGDAAAGLANVHKVHSQEEQNAK